jgi:hypothetical protein
LFGFAFGVLAKARVRGLSRWAFLLVKGTEPDHRGSRTFNDLAGSRSRGHALKRALLTQRDKSPAVALRFREAPAADVHLERVQDQLRHRELAVTLLAQGDELRLGFRLREVDVLGFLLRDRALTTRRSDRQGSNRAR